MTPSLLSVILICLVQGCAQTEDPKPKPTAQRPTLEVGATRVTVRLALTHAARSRGLSGLAALPKDEGMLFVYPEPWIPDYWMAGCLMSLDIAFLADDGTLLQIETLDPPQRGAREHEIASSKAPRPCRLVFEMEGGWFARHGVKVGDRVRGLDRLPLGKAEARR